MSTKLLKVVYSAEKDINTEQKYTCVDNKIHIRFKHFDSGKGTVVIAGFIEKLTFLLTYLMTRGNCLNLGMVTISGEPIVDEHADYFFDLAALSLLMMPDFKYLEKLISPKMPINFKGIKLFKAYSKTDSIKLKRDLLGNIPNIFGLTDKNEIANISNFSELLPVTLEEFLFNDKFELWLTDKSSNVAKATKKFRNKVIKIEEKKQNQNSYCPTNLWESY